MLWILIDTLVYGLEVVFDASTNQKAFSWTLLAALLVLYMPDPTMPGLFRGRPLFASISLPIIQLTRQVN